MARTSRSGRPKGHIRKRGNSYQVLVFTGVDPLTGKRMYASASTTDEREAQKLLRRMVADADEEKHPATRGTLAAAVADWLEIHEAEESTLEGYRGYIRRTILPALGDVQLAKITPQLLERFYAELRKCRRRCGGEPLIDHRVSGEHECRVIRHKRRPGRPRADDVHDCEKAGCTVVECKPHACSPMSPATILQIHAILSSVLTAAVRWGWISSNPADIARKPRQPAPNPTPPSSAQAAQIVEAAWKQDFSWGLLVWLVMVSGLRRAELVALRWIDVDLEKQMLHVARNYVRANGRSIEKDTKSHRARRISIDEVTVALLREHHQRYLEQMQALGVEPAAEAYLFSHQPTFDRPYDPSRVTHRYRKMCADLGIDSHLHALRHYSATELLTAGVDLRTIAGRLGHAGGGTTTLRVYAAWVGESDRRAAEILSSGFNSPSPT